MKTCLILSLIMKKSIQRLQFALSFNLPSRASSQRRPHPSARPRPWPFRHASSGSRTPPSMTFWSLSMLFHQFSFLFLPNLNLFRALWALWALFRALSLQILLVLQLRSHLGGRLPLRIQHRDVSVQLLQEMIPRRWRLTSKGLRTHRGWPRKISKKVNKKIWFYS